jgi:hypothetical protein
MNFTCGQCHWQKDQLTQVAGKPKIPLQVNGPPDLNKQVAKNNPIPKQVGGNKPIPKQVGPGPKNLDRFLDRPPARGPMVWRPFPGPGFQVGTPKPTPQGVVKSGQPIPPVLQQPPPQFGIVRLDPGQPVPGWMVRLQPDGKPQPKSQLDPSTSQPTVTIIPQAPPAILQGGSQLNPALLDGSTHQEPSGGQESYGELLPSDIVQVPPPPPAPGASLHDRGLLPTLNRTNPPTSDATDPSARSSPLEVVLTPPPVADVVAR